MVIYLVFGIVLVALIALVILWFVQKKKKARAEAAAAGVDDSGGAGTEEVDALIKEAERRLAASKQGSLGGLPVFFLVGESGSTKTTILENAGVEPELLAGLVRRDNNIVPTRTANLWFSRKAIFAEAGGKLITEPAKWQRLVRKLQPKAGVAKDATAPRAVLVCYDAENFTRAGAQDAAAGAARALRARLGEMSQAFGINLPVYVVFTRMDRLPFFTDYVRNLTKDEAGQVVGATIPMRDVRAGVYGEEQTARLTGNFEQLFRSLADARPELLSRENDANHQPGAYEFPREFRKIRPAMVQFLVDVCQPSQLTVGPFLRGFYFTGVRPVVINEVAPVTPAAKAQAYDAGSSATGLFKAGMVSGGAAPAAPVGQTRKVPQWLFLTHLFNDVLLADSAAMGASGSSVKTGSARRLLFMAGAVACLLLCVAFTVSFFRNRGLETEARDAAVGISSAESSGQNLASLDALRKLETLRQSLAQLVQFRHEGAPMSYKWGLYTGDSLYPEVRKIYFERFRQLLFLQTQGAILENLRGLPMAGQGPEYQPTYDALKAYLITTSHHDKSTSSFLAPVLTRWWAQGRGPDADRLALAQKQFEFYATELKEENPFSSDNDGQGVEHARAYLKRMGGVESVYAYMLGEAGKKSQPVDYNKTFPGGAQAVSQPYVVPAAFSKGGWTFMKDAIAHPERYTSGEKWVLGDQVSSNLDPAALSAAIKDRYYSDFVKQWRTYIKSASVLKYASLKDATVKLALLSGNQSPLLELFSLASTHTAVDDPNVAKIFQSAQTVVPPGSTDRFILPPNQNYMNALVAIQTALDSIANTPGTPNEAAAQMTMNNATQAKGNVKQLAQAFTIDAEGHVETAVEKLLTDPITYLDPMLRSIDVPELNAGGKSLCGGFRPVLNKYPFNPTATSEVTLAELNGLFRKPDGLLWKFFEEKLQKVMVRQGAQYVVSPTSKVTVNPSFLTFFNAAASFGDMLYADGQDPHFSYSLKPEPSEGVQMMNIRVDGQAISYTAGTPAAFKKFTWQGTGAHEAMLSVRFGNTDLGFARGDGLWAAFHLFQQANASTAQAGGQLLEWVTSSGKGSQPVMLPSGRPLTVRFTLDLGQMPPVFQRGYLSRMTCVQEIAR